MSGQLKWGVVHTEKFWREQARKFETDEFFIVKQVYTVVLVLHFSYVHGHHCCLLRSLSASTFFFFFNPSALIVSPFNAWKEESLCTQVLPGLFFFLSFFLES